ncbi:hypothetical protein [Actinoplanes sp. N902-109]|uniref:hypothetical protein n=1 Tax=Actinoplanes sp. (strain N902-109) TaxID=649831 RepID=UPI000329356D|nr:hypothetical protein [Actinoplanes sp. N902-109]AGL19265.1 hypothetical protein L083_5755 [Actinoplanes sp. N902-109]
MSAERCTALSARSNRTEAEPTTARIQRTGTPHTTWCARDHRCLGDVHRAPDIRADEIGGRAWLTRVRAGDVEYIEIRARIPLHSNGKVARWQLATALQIMRELLNEVTPTIPRLTGRGERGAIGRRTA